MLLVSPETMANMSLCTCPWESWWAQNSRSNPWPLPPERPGGEVLWTFSDFFKKRIRHPQELARFLTAGLADLMSFLSRQRQEAHGTAQETQRW